MRIAFAGTPLFADTVLAALLAAGHEPCVVCTRPDAVAGRGMRPQPSPVKQRALHAGLPLLQPPTFRSSEACAALAAYAPELLIVVAYGLILPATVLAIPRLGAINVHASLLPRWRGASPIQHVLLAGDTTTGISIMQIAPALDAGDVYAQRSTPVYDDDTTETLATRLATLGAQLLLDTLPAIVNGSLPATPQQPDMVTYAAKLTVDDARIDWKQPVDVVSRHVRAFAPRPAAWTRWGERRVKIHAIQAVTHWPFAAAPGECVVDDGKLLVACGNGGVWVQSLQLSGKRPINDRDFINAYCRHAHITFA